MFSVEHASSMGPAVMEEGRGGGGGGMGRSICKNSPTVQMVRCLLFRH